MDDCIFCKIVRGEIPSHKVYEDENLLAFLDISPVHPGHTLVIPKEHHKNFLETPDELLEQLVVTSKKLGIAVKKAVGADGINIITNVEPAASQVIFHTHIHVIPRHEGDGLKTWPQEKYSEGEAEKVAQKISESL